MLLDKKIDAFSDHQRQKQEEEERLRLVSSFVQTNESPIAQGYCTLIHSMLFGVAHLELTFLLVYNILIFPFQFWPSGFTLEESHL